MKRYRRVQANAKHIYTKRNQITQDKTKRNETKKTRQTKLKETERDKQN